MYRFAVHGTFFHRWLVSGSLLIVGCTDPVSHYVIPQDGRARPLFRNGRVVVELAGGPMNEACLRAVLAYSGSSRLFWRQGYVVPTTHPPVAAPFRALAAPPTQTTAARYYLGPFGEPRFDLQPGPGLTEPQLVGMQVVGARRSRRATDPPVTPAALNFAEADPWFVFPLGLPLLYAIPGVVGMLLAFGPLTAGNALPQAGAAVDQVNAYNDLVRTPGSPCGAPEIRVVPAPFLPSSAGVLP